MSQMFSQGSTTGYSSSGSTRQRKRYATAQRTYKAKRARVGLALKQYVKKQIDKAIEDKYDTSPNAATGTFAAYSGDSTPTPDQVSAGYLSIPARPALTQGVENGGETGEFIGNEIRLKKMEMDITMYPQSNAEIYSRTIKIYLIELTSVNAMSNFNMEDCFENDYVLDSLNNANYPDVFYLTPRNTQNDNFKSVYKILKSWTFKTPNSINGADGANWIFTEKLKYDFKGKRVRLDSAGNYLNYDCRFIFTTDVGNDGTAVTPAMVGTIATVASSGVNLLYKRKNWYEDA